MKDCEECLGELFSAQKSKIERLEININSLIETSSKAESYRRIFESKLMDRDEKIKALQKRLDDVTDFLKDLRDFSKWTWGMTYRDRITKFLDDRGI